MGRKIYPALLFLTFLYVLTMTPTVHVHDAGELTTSSWVLGIGHPPGAPLYMLLNKLFMLLLPIGHIALRASLFSALMGTIAFLLLVNLGFKVTANPLLSLTAGFMLALSSVVWSQAGMAEVYTLEILLLLLFFLTLLHAESDSRLLRLSAFTWGLLLTCHMGLSPVTPLVLLLLAGFKREKGQSFPIALLRLVPWTLLPLTLYLYLPLRSLADPAMDWGNPETIQNIFWHVTNRQVRGRMLTLPLEIYLIRTAEYLLILWKNLHIFLALTPIGIIHGFKNHRLFTSLALLTLFADAGFVVLMDTAPLASEAYAIPSITALVLLIVLAFQWLNRLPSMRIAAPLLLAFAVIFPLTDFKKMDQHRNFSVKDSIDNLLNQLPSGAVLFTWEDNTTFPLAELVFAEGARPDLEIYDRQGNLFRSLYDRPLWSLPGPDLPLYRQSVEEPFVTDQLSRGREVFFTTPFLDYEPAEWKLFPSGTVGRALLREQVSPPTSSFVPDLRTGAYPDWMSRQVLSDDRIRRAFTEIKRGEIGPARTRLENALAEAEIAETAVRISQLALTAGDPGLAERASLKALDLKPGLAPALSLLGFAEIQQEKLQAAEEHLLEAYRIDPSLHQPPTSLGLLNIKRQNWAEAEKWLTLSLTQNPRQPETLYNRALVRQKLGRFSEAVEDLETALELKPDFAKARQKYLILLQKEGNEKGAL